MANSPQGRKRGKQADVRRNHNASMRSRGGTYVKKTLAAIHAGNHGDAVAAFKLTTPIIDGMVNKRLYTKNKSARIKSRLNDRIKAIAS